MKPSTRVRVARLLKPLQEFLRLETSAGYVLMAATVAAMIVANSPLSAKYHSLLEFPLAINIGQFSIRKTSLHWIDDGLMVLFFFVIGLELKRELIDGHLASLRRASLPAFAAAGGMLGPAMIYIALNRHDPTAMHGWAIPTATDIAFALGVLSLLGKRVPPALKAFLLSVAIFDDLGAIVVIALFYTTQLLLMPLLIAAVLVIVLFALNRLSVIRPTVYFIVAFFLWLAVLKSGVHATLAGVIVAMFIPLRTATGASPAKSLEHSLHPWVAFGVLPIFAFANAGVTLAGLSPDDVGRTVSLGIMIGLFVGKQIGIFVMCWLTVKLRLGALPEGATWGQLYGIAILCGIGFTMSLFIASLAFAGSGADYHGAERLAILMGSLVSGLVGFFVLKIFAGRHRAKTVHEVK
jgi:Na+:H+ antiporter, NhaA family